MSTISFEGRVAIVTGAGRGLGRAYARGLASRGAAVVVNDLGGTVDGQASDRRPADDVVAEIEAAGGRAVPSYASVATPAGAQEIVQAALDAFGTVDVVVANAGILRGVSVGKTSTEDIEDHLAVHTKGAFYMARAAWPTMRAREYGRFVFISSSAGLFGIVGAGAYGTAKAAVVGLSNTIALEGARHDIRANCVAPVAASTRMANVASAGQPPPDLPARLSEESVAPMVVYLASEECEFTGAIFSAGGGRFARIVIASAPGWWSPTAPPSAEDVRDHLSEITDMSAPLVFDRADDELRLLYQAPAAGGLGGAR